VREADRRSLIAYGNGQRGGGHGGLLRCRPMFPVIARLGPFTIYSYGLMMALGFIVCGQLYGRELKRRGLDPDMAGVVVFYAVVGGVLGARAYYMIMYWHEVAEHPLQALVSGSGLVWYGGLAGGLVASLLAFRRHGSPWVKMFDACAPYLALAYVFGRLGCFFAGDGDYGPPSNLPWAMSFPNGAVPTDVPVHPTPLYEAAVMLGIFAILSRLRFKARPDGWLFAVFLMLQGLERMVLEYWRVDEVPVGPFSDAQLIGAATLLAGLVWWWRVRGRAVANQGG